MNLLNYHSWADILSTLIVIAVILLPVFGWIHSLNPKHRNPQN